MADELTNSPVETSTGTITPAPGTGGLGTQVQGQAATVSTAANATGDIGPGHFIKVTLTARSMSLTVTILR